MSNTDKSKKSKDLIFITAAKLSKKTKRLNFSLFFFLKSLKFFIGALYRGLRSLIYTPLFSQT